MDKLILKFLWKRKGPEQPRQSVKKKTAKLKDNHYLMSSHYQAMVIETACCQNRHIHRNWIQNPEINPHIYGQLIFDKGIKVTE